MNYLEKYLKYKNKYVFLKKQEKQIGGGLSIIQYLYTDIKNYCFLNKSNEADRRALIDQIMTLTQGTDGFIIAVRGNGLCMLNAFTTSYFLMKRNFRSVQILEDFGTSINVKNLEDGVEETNPLALAIDSDYKIRYEQVTRNFTEYTNIIVSNLMSNFGIETEKECYDTFELKQLKPEESIYAFIQLGTIISALFNCVIVNIDIMSNVANYVIPNLSNPSLADLTLLGEMVNRREVDVVIIISVGPHYNSFIPHYCEDAIIDANIALFNKILATTSPTFELFSPK